MKKLLLVLLLLITGCSGQWNLKIDNDYVDEDVSLSFPRDASSDQLFRNQTSESISVYGGNEKYKMDKKEDGSNYNVNYSYRHDILKFGKSNFMIKCFSSNNITDDGEIINIETSDRFNCINLDDGAYLNEVKFNITTDLEVVSNNADEIIGNKYIWVFDSDNYENKNINIKIKKDNSLSKKIVDGISNYFVIIIVIILIIVFFILFLMHIKKKNRISNEL